MSALRDLVRVARESVCRVVVNGGTSTGSGFLVEGSQEVVTCAHVLSGVGVLNRVDLVFEAGSVQAPLGSISQDPGLDIAVLNCDGVIPKAIQGLALDDVTNREQGDSIVVLGFPLGEPTLTVTTGIVSAKGRFKFPDLPAPIDAFKLDASINRGNSGGPCMSVDTGAVLGVTSSQAPVSASLVTNVGKQIAQAKQQLSRQRGGVLIGGVNPLMLPLEIGEILYQAVEQTRQLGIGYAISARYVGPAL